MGLFGKLFKGRNESNAFSAQHDVPDAGHPAGGADGDPDGLA